MIFEEWKNVTTQEQGYPEIKRSCTKVYKMWPSLRRHETDLN